MVMPPPLSEKDQLPIQSSVQQSALQQHAATRYDLLHEIDSVSSQSADSQDIPPPAYGDIHGEIRSQDNSLDTCAFVADDGRVNIDINGSKLRLSRVFIPALRQHIHSAQEDGPLPQPYIPPSLGGQDGTPPPPSLNVVIHVVGSRGDVQPFIALGKVLKNTYGHRVRLATHSNFKAFVEEHGLEFFNIGGDPSLLMAFMVKNPGLISARSLLKGDIARRRRDVAEYIQGCWRSCYQAGNGMSPGAGEDASEMPGSDTGSKSATRSFVADCIIAKPPSFAHIHCAEKLGIPLHIMFTMPYSPTQAFPHPLANIRSSNADPQLTNYLSYSMVEFLSWQGLGDIINRFRSKCLGLDPVSLVWAPGMLHRLRIPHTYCWSPALIPKPNDWGPHVSISGFHFLPTPEYTPAPDLRSFLEAGSTPIYIGFGSIVLDDPDAMTELIFQAVWKTGQRALVSKGWGGIGAIDVPDNIFMLGSVPHDWLFKHVSCVVHHGGAGTTAAGIAAGRPTVVVPFFGDQPFWGAIVAQSGAGPSPIPHKKLTADRLAKAISFCLERESQERARDLASKVVAEQGTDMSARSFHQYLQPDRLRCTLDPSRVAAWRIKHTQVKLSPFAACALANADLLDFHDLKLFRPQEYETDEGPWDPITGGFVAACGVFGGMAKGLAELPSETYKAIQLGNRQKSEASLRATSNGQRTTPLTSPEQSQTNLNTQECPTHLRYEPSAPGPSSNARNGDLRSNSHVPQVDQNHGMTRQTHPHTSKGFGRFAKVTVQGPMDVSMGISKGLYNVPKLWGDDTVRRSSQVNNFTSGAKAAGKEFGLAWYDGVTGLVTHPWHGARKEGANGFFKGMGRGIGGFLTKPAAAVFGVPGYVMKGVQKEAQNLIRGNVQDYIFASRTEQGYSEWLQSSEAEKQDVIVRWKLIQKHLKRRRHRKEADETIQDLLQMQRNTGNHVGEHSRPAEPDDRAYTAASLASSREPSLLEAEVPDEEDAHVEHEIQEILSQLQRPRPELEDGNAPR